MVKKQQRYESSQQSSSYDNISQPIQKGYYTQEDESEEEQSVNVEKKQQLLKLEEERIKKQLKELPYGMILKQRQELEKSKNELAKTKKLKKAQNNMKNKNSKHQEQELHHGPRQTPIHKRPHRKPVPVIFQSTRQKSIDPRFQDYAGSYNEDLASKTYSFIPKIQQQQIQTIRKTLDRAKNNNARSRNNKKLSEQEKQVLKQQYNRLTNERRQQQLTQIHKQVKHNLRQKHQQSQRNDNNRFDRHGSSERRDNYGRNDRGYNSNNNGYRNDRGGQNRNNGYRNDRGGSDGGYRNDNRNDDRGSGNFNKNFIPKKVYEQQFEKVKQARMTDEQRKEYLKKKEKKIHKNQQVDRNNMLYQARNNRKERMG